MNAKTRAEYESIKARWQTMPGKVEDVLQVNSTTGMEYRYLTLDVRTSLDLGDVEETVARLAVLAVHDDAYLTMHVHPDEVWMRIGLATYDNTPYVVQTPTPPEVLAEEPCGEPSDSMNVGEQ